MNKYANAYRVWYVKNGECDFIDMTGTDEDEVVRRFRGYFPDAVIDEVELCRENVQIA